MRVVFVSPASPQLINPMVMPPLGLWHLGAVLKGQGADVIYHDANVDGPFPGADVYGVTGVSPQAVSMREIIKRLRAEGEYIVAGGPHATLFPKVVEGWGADCVVVGEGEEVIIPIAQTKHKGIIKADRIKGLDGLPFADRSDAARYTYALDGRMATTMMSTRGCPYSCAFCCGALWGHLVTTRSAENVLAEAKQLRELGYGAIMFYDDTFTIDHERVKDIGKGLCKMGLAWRCFIRANTVDEELIKVMAENGCEEVGLGVETGSQRILDIIDKRTTTLQNMRAINLCRKHGISVKVFIIVGLPGETPETVEENWTRSGANTWWPPCLEISRTSSSPPTWTPSRRRT